MAEGWSISLALVTALAGGAGAVLRFVVDALVSQLFARRAARRGQAPVTLPLGLLVVNMTGSFAIGVLAGVALQGGAAWSVIGVGVLGGYTTFSAASLAAVQLLRQRRVGLACLVGAGQLFAAVLVAGAGLWVGRLLGG